MREDVLIQARGAVVPVSVGLGVHRFLEYIDSKRGCAAVLQDMNDPDERRFRIEQSHRFENGYMNAQMGKFYGLEREAVRRWGSDGLTLVMLTLSASMFDSDDYLMSPVDHLDSIMDSKDGSWRAVRTAMGRAVGDLEWEYARILEPHTPQGNYASSGYCHVHVGLFIRDPEHTLSESDFSGVLNSHVANCETASSAAHTVAKSVSLSRYDPAREGGLGAYLTAYLGEQLETTVEDAPDWMLRYMAVLWASGRRRVSFSNGAQEWISADYESRKSEEERIEEAIREGFRMFDESDWTLIGVETVNEDGEVEFHPCDEPGGSGGYMDFVQLPTDSQKQDWLIKDVYTDISSL